MPHVLAQPQQMETAAAAVAAIGTSIDEAKALAAARTTGLAAAAADEVSASIATRFSAYAHEWQLILSRTTAIHRGFAQALTAAGTAYANVEAGSAMTMAPGAGGVPTTVTKTVTKALADPYVTFVLDGSGTPIPPQSFVDHVVSKYVVPNFPAGRAQGLYMPAGEYPDSGVKDLPQDIAI